MFILRCTLSLNIFLPNLLWGWMCWFFCIDYFDWQVDSLYLEQWLNAAVTHWNISGPDLMHGYCGFMMYSCLVSHSMPISCLVWLYVLCPFSWIVWHNVLCSLSPLVWQFCAFSYLVWLNVLCSLSYWSAPASCIYMPSVA